MDNSLDKKELETTRYLHACIGDILSLLSLHFKGHTTLNDLRIGNYIGLMSHYDAKPTNNKRISAELSIPRSTVSRIVTDFIEQKWVTEHPHPEDGRKKQLSIATGHPLADNFEKDFRVIINDLLQCFESNKIVRVDPSKKSY